MNDSIKVVVTDIDGVLTDGKLILGEGAEINKSLCFKDLDAVSSFRAIGIKFGIISGESDQFTELVRERMTPDYFFAGCKDKRKALEDIASREGLTLSHFCYIGDGKYDIEAIHSAGIGACPRDAIEEVKRMSDVVLHRKGGEGCLSEVFSLLCNENIANSSESGTSHVLRDLIAHKEVLEFILGNGELQKIICNIAEEITRSLKTGGSFCCAGTEGALRIPNIWRPNWSAGFITSARR